jgi:hypothetical protein
MMTFEYRSILDNSVQTIKIDISLKKNLKLSPVKRQIHTIFVDKILEEPIFGEHFINCIDLVEAVAEKIRAGLTRTYPAIRDFFDIWFIKKNAEIDFTSTELKALVNTKLADVNYAYTISEENFSLLEKQIITDLKPVLSKEWLHFSKDDLREVYDLVMTFSGKMVE